MDKSENSQERRDSPRTKVYLNKTFNCEIQLSGEIKKYFVHIENISTTGLQIHTDFPLPDNTDIPITVQAHEPLKLKVKKIWQKELLGGIFIIGLEFVNLIEENEKDIIKFMETYSPEGRRKAYRLSKVLAVEMFIGEKLKKFYTLTQDLSAKGMRIMYDEDIPVGTILSLKVLLSFDAPSISLNCRVMWAKKTSFDYYLIGFEFIEISDEDAKRIEEFIETSFKEEVK